MIDGLRISRQPCDGSQDCSCDRQCAEIVSAIDGVFRLEGQK